MKQSSTPDLLCSCKALFNYQRLPRLLTILLLLGSLSGWAHGVMVGYQVGSFPNGNNVRVWIEHWHGPTTSVYGFPLQYRLLQNGTPGALTTTYATGYANNIDTVGLQQNNGDITFLPGACGTRADNENNWVYWDFNLTACGNNVVDFEIIAGTAATTDEGCSSLYPQTIKSVNIPGINAPDAVIHTCPPYHPNYTVQASDLNHHYQISSLCDPNPTTVLSYGSDSWTVGNTPIPSWTFPQNGGSVTIDVTDNVTGQTASTTMKVSFADAKPPRFQNFPGDTTLYGDANCQAVFNYLTPQGVDGCSGTASVVQTAGSASGATLNYGQHTYSFKVSDTEGNDTTQSFTVTVVDSSFNVQDLTTGSRQIQTTDVDQSGLNAYAGNSPYTFNFQDPLPAGSVITNTEVIYTVNSPYLAHNRIQVGGSTIGDAHPNQTTGQFTVSKSGDLPNYTYGGSNQFKLYSWWNGVTVKEVKIRFTYAQNTGLCQKYVNVPVPQTNSNCGYQWFYNDRTYNSNASGIYPVGTTQVTWYKQDSYGNQTTHIQKITVTDDELPSLVTKADTVYLNAQGLATVAKTDVIAGYSDNCGIDSVFLSQYNFDCSHLGEQRIAATAVDIHGNQKLDSVSITVLDTTSPAINFATTDLYLDVFGRAYIDTLSIISSDNCPDTAYADRYQFGCSDLGQQNVKITAVDASGNSAEETFQLNVHDTIAPVLSVKNVTAYLDASGNTSINATYIDNNTSDNCGIDTLLLSQYDFDCSDLGANTVSFTASDVNGNSSATTVRVDVLDTVSPVAQAKSITVYLDANGHTSITAAQLDNGSSDACGIDTLVLSNYNFTCAEVGANLVTLTASDVNGNSSSATVTVSVIDSISPMVRARDITVYLDQSGTANISAADVDNGSQDACGIQQLLLSQTSFACTDLGANMLSLTVGDVNGNTASTALSVTVEDTITPVVKSKNILVHLDNNGQAVITPAMVDRGSYDNCAFKLSLSQSVYGCADKGLNLETLTATDSSGNSSTTNFMIEVRDTISPSLVSKNITVQLGATGQASIAASQLDNGSFDNCSHQLFFTASKTSFSCADLGANSVQITVTDAEGNSSSATTTVLVEDNIKPVAQAQNLTLQLGANGMASITAAQVNSGSSDNCSIDSMWVSQENFSCADLGTNSLQFTAMDQSGNTHTTNFTVKVEDNAAPVVATQNLTVQLNANGQASITTAMIDNGSTDNCLINSLTLDKTNFTCTDLGVNTVTLTAMDVAGNSSSASATVTVEDNIAPSVLAQNLTVQLDANGQAVITPAMIDNGSTDNCSISSLSLDLSSFGCSDLGTNTVILTGVDAAGNSSSASVTVTVEDNIAPSVLAQNLTVQLDANGQAVITPAMIDKGSTDNCSISSLSLDVSSFDCSKLGPNQVTLTAIDVAGNSSSASATVTVEDNIAPSVLAQNLTVQLDANGQAVITPAMIDKGSTDNCSINSLSLDVSSFDCSNLGTNTVILTGVDAAGNSSSASATVTVEDNIAPSVLAQNLTIQLDANGQAVITPAMIDNGSSDNCSITNLSLDITSFDCTDAGNPVTVTLTATDQSSNSATATAVVTVVDQVAPIAQVQNITVYLDANGSRTVLPTEVDNGSFDNCGAITINLNETVYDCADLGQNLVTFTATDAHGNSSQQTAFITVVDTISPSIDNLPASITAYADANQCATNVQWPAITASDNCSAAMVTTGKANGGVFNIGLTTVTVNVVDGSGNSISQSFDVNVVDTISPQISGMPSSYSVSNNAGTCDATVSWNVPVATDNCSGVSLSSSHAPGSTFPVGTTVVTYTASDAHNNITTASFTVTVSDVVDPVISGVPANLTVAADKGQCGANVAFNAPQVFDNCSGVTLSASHNPGDFFSVGTTTVNYLATDAAGNSVAASFEVTVKDRQAPVVSSVPATDTIGQCNANYTYQLPVASDNCGGITINQIGGLPSGSIFPIGATNNVFRITDQYGNDTTVSFTVVVVPQGQPTLPSLLEICENASPVEISMGQNLVWSGDGIANGSMFDPAQAGSGRHQLNYSFTDVMGCSVSGSISVTVTPLPISPEIVQLGSTTIGTKAAYTSYQWYRDGEVIPGATDPTYEYTVGGNYQVMVGNSFGCEVYGEGYVVSSNGGSIGLEELNLSELSVYPNPSRGQLTIDLMAEGENEVQLTIFSIEGKKIFEQNLQSQVNGKVELDLGQLPDATYFMYIRSRGETEVRKLILY